MLDQITHAVTKEDDKLGRKNNNNDTHTYVRQIADFSFINGNVIPTNNHETCCTGHNVRICSAALHCTGVTLAKPSAINKHTKIWDPKNSS